MDWALGINKSPVEIDMALCGVSIKLLKVAACSTCFGLKACDHVLLMS
jgi:hypothetical protein